MRKEYKLPTIIGLAVLVVGVVAGVFLVQSGQVFRLRASPEETPQQVRITNIRDTSFTVSWVTEQETIGFLSYGRSASLGQTANDDQNPNTPSLVHHVTVSALSSNTTYFFKVGSGKNLFDNDGKPYQVTTAPQATVTPGTDIIFGTVQTPSGAPARGAIVYVTISGVSPLSTLTDSSGKWTIPLSQARSASLASFASYQPTDRAQIFVQKGDQFASATIRVGAARPVPPITLGETHDFTNLEPVESSDLPSSSLIVPEEGTPSATPSSGFRIEEEETVGSKSVSLLSPDDGESLNTTKPSFVGTGTPGTKFTITVESENAYTDQVTVDSQGEWSWTPPENLEPGEHTVTLSWKDENGQTRIIRRTFTVLAAGTSDLPSFTASPSGETATPSPSPSASPSARTTTVSTEGGVPVAGNLTTTVSLFIMGAVLIFSGLFLPRILRN